MTVAIHAADLTRRFGDLVAVDHISFDIEQGEIFGLLGPNGAGKTTTLSMLSTMLEPTSGTATVMGIDVTKDQDGVRKAIGIVFQARASTKSLPHGRIWISMAGSTGSQKPPGNSESMSSLNLVELFDRRNDIVKTFSGGMRRRLEIARGLLHHPAVLFLDEPTLGLDPQTRNHLWKYIEDLAQEKNITIILTTHYMEEADRLCNRIAIIDHGKIIALDTPVRLKDSIGGDVVTIKSPDTEKTAAVFAVPWINRIETHDDEVILTLQNAEQRLSMIVTLLNDEKIPITSISVHKPTLEDVFLSFTGKTIREQDISRKDAMRMHFRMMRH